MNKRARQATTILLMAMLLMSGPMVALAQEDIPVMRMQVVSEPSPTEQIVITASLQDAAIGILTGEQRIGPGTYIPVTIQMKNIDSELPMPAGRLYGAILREDKVGTLTADPYKFWQKNIGDRLGVLTSIFWDISPIDSGKEMKVSTTAPGTGFVEKWYNYNEEFYLTTERFLPGETIEKTVYVMAHNDVAIGGRYKFRAILVTGAWWEAGTVVATQDATFYVDYPKINMWFVFGSILVLAAVSWYLKVPKTLWT